MGSVDRSAVLLLCAAMSTCSDGQPAPAGTEPVTPPEQGRLLLGPAQRICIHTTVVGRLPARLGPDALSSLVRMELARLQIAGAIPPLPETPVGVPRALDFIAPTCGVTSGHLELRLRLESRLPAEDRYSVTGAYVGATTRLQLTPIDRTAVTAYGRSVAELLYEPTPANSQEIYWREALRSDASALAQQLIDKTVIAGR